MEDIIYYSNLFDYYEKLLTKKEQEYFRDYYFNNLSLQEIADNYEVSRNAISKTLKEAKEKLDYYENNLNLFKNKEKIKSIVSNEVLKKIEKYI